MSTLRERADKALQENAEFIRASKERAKERERQVETAQASLAQSLTTLRRLRLAK